MAEHDDAAQEDAPFGIFRTFYTLLTWLSTAVLMVISVWLLWELFTHTPAGTARSQSLDTVRPTITALAAAMPTVIPGAEDLTVPLPAACAGCHTIEGTSSAGKVCPNLTHVAEDAAKWIADAAYTGKATTVEAYIRESILEPNAFIVPGNATWMANGNSIMPAAIGAGLSKNDLDALVKYLASLK